MKMLLLRIVGCCCLASSVLAGPLEDAERDFAASNSQIDVLYKRATAAIVALDPGNARQKQLFEQAQSTWAQYREAQANFAASCLSDGGTNFRVEYLRVSTKLANERIKYLQDLLAPAQSEYTPNS